MPSKSRPTRPSVAARAISELAVALRTRSAYVEVDSRCRHRQVAGLAGFGDRHVECHRLHAAGARRPGQTADARGHTWAFPCRPPVTPAPSSCRSPRRGHVDKSPPCRAQPCRAPLLSGVSVVAARCSSRESLSLLPRGRRVRAIVSPTTTTMPVRPRSLYKRRSARRRRP